MARNMGVVDIVNGEGREVMSQVIIRKSNGKTTNIASVKEMGNKRHFFNKF